MFSRLLNIWVIKQRAKEPVWVPMTPHHNPTSPMSPVSPASSTPDLGDLLTEYVVDLGHGRSVSLRGLASDLKAITTGPWLTAKTHVQGYLEAAAKLTVYLVAALSGNMTQAGNIIFMALLLITAGLLGLSNAHAKTLRMRGRIAAPTTDRLSQPDGDPAAPSSPDPEMGRGRGDGAGGGAMSGRRHLDTSNGTASAATTSPFPDTASLADSSTWPPATTRTSTDASGLENFVRRI